VLQRETEKKDVVVLLCFGSSIIHGVEDSLDSDLSLSLVDGRGGLSPSICSSEYYKCITRNSRTGKYYYSRRSYRLIIRA